ncbi:MAG TPA: polysaccharide deacetylase family protein [Chryseolinea sp.]|nr:polysaccharide deacetylase family protein [Chryseolinea sp.]
MLRHILTQIRWRTIETFSRRNFNLSGSASIVSFTFDDFPQSALQIGGSILQSYGARGTYYAAMGLMDQVNGLGRQFSAEDLSTLLKDGHELGSHTYDHISCRSSSLSVFQANAIKGKQAIDAITGGGFTHHFSYPYGHATFRAKQRIGSAFSSCRGIIPGINKAPVDLNLLRANSLYSCSFDIIAIECLLEANEKCKGWLIFYTHDISENPSPFGCKPGEFESVVKLVVKRQVPIVPMGQAVIQINLRRR